MTLTEATAERDNARHQFNDLDAQHQANPKNRRIANARNEASDTLTFWQGKVAYLGAMPA